ncbi:MAG: DUF2058 domain-containing protein [Pseudomonadales bacterium]
MPKKKKPLGSLRDQFREAGLITAKQAKKADKGALRSELRIKKGIEIDEGKQRIESDRVKKLQKDRKKNDLLNQEKAKKAEQAAIQQLITSHSQRQNGDHPYQFTDQNKVKKIYVSSDNKTQLNRGYLAIVKSADQYDLVPEVIAEKIKARNPASILFLHDRSKDLVDEDDPYKDYPIPEDLEW